MFPIAYYINLFLSFIVFFSCMKKVYDLVLDTICNFLMVFGKKFINQFNLIDAFSDVGRIFAIYFLSGPSKSFIDILVDGLGLDLSLGVFGPGTDSDNLCSNSHIFVVFSISVICNYLSFIWCQVDDSHHTKQIIHKIILS